MAKDPQSKKRKGKSSVSEADAEQAKTKKTKNVSAEVVEAPEKKRKATEEAAPVKVKKSKMPKYVTNEAVDPEPASDDGNGAQAAKEANVTKVSTKSKKGASKDAAVAAKPTSKTTTKVAKTTEIEASEPNGQPGNGMDWEDEGDSDVDDQTEALLKGFASDGDDEDALNEEGMPTGEPVPERKQLSKAEEKKLKKIAESGASDKPGVVYIGRIPHGFFEHGMRAYFQQFGKILKLRLSRNKKTGASRHHAWIQFESATVADIVARTMDNYLMFGHLLKVKLVPDEQVHKELFKGANKRFKKVPWNKLVGRKIAQGASEEQWNERVEREEKRRDEKTKKMKDIGYEFEAPKVKSAKGVSKKEVGTLKLATDGTSDNLAIEAAPLAEEPSKSKKKSKKAGNPEVHTKQVNEEEKSEGPAEKEQRADALPPTTEDVEEKLAALAEEKSKKSKKGKKSKTVEVSEPEEEEAAGIATEAASEPKAKKSKKLKRKSGELDVQVADDDAEAVETKVKAKNGKKSKPEKSIA